METTYFKRYYVANSCCMGSIMFVRYVIDFFYKMCYCWHNRHHIQKIMMIFEVEYWNFFVSYEVGMDSGNKSKNWVSGTTQNRDNFSKNLYSVLRANLKFKRSWNMARNPHFGGGYLDSSQILTSYWTICKQEPYHITLVQLK